MLSWIYTFMLTAICVGILTQFHRKYCSPLPYLLLALPVFYSTPPLLLSDLGLLCAIKPNFARNTFLGGRVYQPSQAQQVLQGQSGLYILRHFAPTANSCSKYHTNCQTRAAQKAEASVTKCARCTSSHFFFF